jgi:hypothetical protein
MKLGLAITAGLLGWFFIQPGFAAERLVRLAPMKGIVIGVPKGWKACDLFFDQKLGKVEDPHARSAQLCEPNPRNNPTMKLGAFSPAGPNSSKLFVLYMNMSPTTSQTIKGLTPQMLERVASTICAEWVKSAARDKTRLETCGVRKASLDDKPALVTTVVQTSGDPTIGQSVTEVWEVPFENGFAQFNFTWPKAGDSAIERIKDSIDLE